MNNQKNGYSKKDDDNEKNEYNKSNENCNNGRRDCINIAL